MTLEYGVDVTLGTALQTICDAPAADTCRLVTGISLFNNTAGIQVVPVFYRQSGTDYRMANPQVAGYGTAHIICSYVLHSGRSLRANSSITAFRYVVSYGVDPHGTGFETYEADGSCAFHSQAYNLLGTAWHVILGEPDPYTRHICRVVTFGNHWILTPTTTLAVRKISTGTIYEMKQYTLAAMATDCWSHHTDGTIVIEPDHELVIQHSLDPIGYAVTVHYATAGVAMS